MAIQMAAAEEPLYDGPFRPVWGEPGGAILGRQSFRRRGIVILRHDDHTILGLWIMYPLCPPIRCDASPRWRK